jgi:hypothetical protein
MSSYLGIENLLNFQLVQVNLRPSTGRRISRLVEMLYCRAVNSTSDGSISSTIVAEGIRGQPHLWSSPIAAGLSSSASAVGTCMGPPIYIEHRGAPIPSREPTSKAFEAASRPMRQRARILGMVLPDKFAYCLPRGPFTKENEL